MNTQHTTFGNGQGTATIAAVKQAGEDLKTTAAEGAREIGSVASSEAARIGEMARDWWLRHAQTALDAASGVKEEAAVISERARGYVRDEPVKALLIAAAAGAVISGLLIAAARRGD